MITPPSYWDTLWADPDSVLEVRLTVYFNSSVTVAYTNDDLSSCSLEGSLFKDLSIGNVCSARLRFVIKDASDVFSAFAQNQKITFECRLKNSARTTAYVSQGTYYLDSASVDNSGNVEIVAYDVINRIADYVSQQTSNMAFSSYLSRIRSMAELTSDWSNMYYNSDLSDTVGILHSSSSPATLNYVSVKKESANIPVRKVLETVATLAGGNFALRKNGTMKLFRLDAGPTITSSPTGILVTATNLYKDERPQVITGVDLSSGNGTFASSSGWRISGSITNDVCIAGSVDVAITAANNMHTEERNIRVSNVRVDSAYITPLFEIGDIVSVDIGNGQYYNFMLCDYSVDYVGGCWGYLGVPKSSNSVAVSVEAVWDSTHGWVSNFTPVPFHSTTPTLSFVNKYQFTLKAIPFSGDNTYKRTMARVASGIETLSTTVRYFSTETAQLKTIDITGYLAEKYIPIESSSTYDWEIHDLYYYCNDIPDDAVGARVYSHSIKLKDPNVIASGYIDVTFSASVAGNYHY